MSPRRAWCSPEVQRLGVQVDLVAVRRSQGMIGLRFTVTDGRAAHILHDLNDHAKLFVVDEPVTTPRRNTTRSRSSTVSNYFILYDPAADDAAPSVLIVDQQRRPWRPSTPRAQPGIHAADHPPGPGRPASAVPSAATWCRASTASHVPRPAAAGPRRPEIHVSSSRCEREAVLHGGAGRPAEARWRRASGASRRPRPRGRVCSATCACARAGRAPGGAVLDLNGSPSRRRPGDREIAARADVPHHPR